MICDIFLGGQVRSDGDKKSDIRATLAQVQINKPTYFLVNSDKVFFRYFAYYIECLTLSVMN